MTIRHDLVYSNLYKVTEIIIRGINIIDLIVVFVLPELSSTSVHSSADPPLDELIKNQCLLICVLFEYRINHKRNLPLLVVHFFIVTARV